MAQLTRAFFARDALCVARDLLGAELVRGEVRLRITEVEAYRYPGDSANHCRSGRTARNEPMWGQAGRAYVYLCYGMHHLLNLVTGEEGEGAAVLIRACEPLAGHAEIVARRGLHGLAALKPNTLAGPGKVGQALGLDRSWNVHDLTQAGGLEVHTAAALNGSPESVQVLVGPRVGIGYASAEDQAAPYRLALGGSPWVSHRRTLREE